MKTFLTWLAVTLTIFGVTGASYHYYLDRNPYQVVVVLDTSFPMRNVWHKVSDTIEDLDGKRYTEYALITDKNQTCSWSKNLKLDKIRPYGPRDFSGLAKNTAAFEDSTVYLISNAGRDILSQFPNWKLIRLEP